MSDQAKALRGLLEQGEGPLPVTVELGPSKQSRVRTVAVTSGKGGVGKSNIALNLAIALAQKDVSVCLLDANLGLGNIDLLCGLNGYWNLSHVVTGARSLQEIVLQGPAGVHVIPGASGLTDLADCPAEARREILAQLDELEQGHDFLIIDTGSGIHRPVREFVMLADLVLLVTTPEPTSIADAYATIKSLATAQSGELQLLVNQADSSEQARAVTDRLQQTARMFLRTEVGAAGSIPRDPQVGIAVTRRRPFLTQTPHSPAAHAIEQVARRVKTLSTARFSPGAFFPEIGRRLIPEAA